MGRIKDTILRKQDRPRTEPKPPSMRRIKRMNHDSIESSRSGRNNRFIPSRVVSLRGLRRSGEKAIPRSGTFSQVMPDVLVLKLKKKHYRDETVVHEHYSDERKDKTTTRRVKQLTCRTDDSVRVEQFELMVKQGMGKIIKRPAKSIWHRVDKQDAQYKPSKPHYRGNTGRRKL